MMKYLRKLITNNKSESMNTERKYDLSQLTEEINYHDVESSYLTLLDYSIGVDNSVIATYMKDGKISNIQCNLEELKDNHPDKVNSEVLRRVLLMELIQIIDKYENIVDSVESLDFKRIWIVELGSLKFEFEMTYYKELNLTGISSDCDVTMYKGNEAWTVFDVQVITETLVYYIQHGDNLYIKIKELTDNIQKLEKDSFLMYDYESTIHMDKINNSRNYVNSNIHPSSFAWNAGYMKGIISNSGTVINKEKLESTGILKYLYDRILRITFKEYLNHYGVKESTGEILIDRVLLHNEEVKVKPKYTNMNKFISYYGDSKDCKYESNELTDLGSIRAFRSFHEYDFDLRYSLLSLYKLDDTARFGSCIRYMEYSEYGTHYLYLRGNVIHAVSENNSRKFHKFNVFKDSSEAYDVWLELVDEDLTLSYEELKTNTLDSMYFELALIGKNRDIFSSNKLNKFKEVYPDLSDVYRSTEGYRELSVQLDKLIADYSKRINKYIHNFKIK